MLPQLLNIIGGTNVRASACISRANGHASSPEPSTTPMLPTSSIRFAADVEILARERGEDERGREHVHADPVDQRHVRLDAARVQPAERDDENTGRMMPRMRSSIDCAAIVRARERTRPAQGCTARGCRRRRCPRAASSTNAASIAIVSPVRRAAWNDTSSSSRSITVYSRRAPMFSWRLVDRERDLREPPDAVGRELEMHLLGREQRLVLPRQARVGARSGSARSPSTDSGDSSTRIGKRPCSSGIRSDGFDRWNAPDAMNRM